jgi:hypothetical protein
LKNRENKVPTDPKSLFKIASISKLYVDAVVIQFINTSGGNSWSKSESVYKRFFWFLKKY